MPHSNKESMGTPDASLSHQSSQQASRLTPAAATHPGTAYCRAGPGHRTAGPAGASGCPRFTPPPKPKAPQYDSSFSTSASDR